MRNKAVLILVGFLIAFAEPAICQHIDAAKLEQIMDRAIKNAHPASVRIWGYDTTAQQCTGGQFSGVVVTGDGYILTAAHVTSPGNTYKVMFANGIECVAKALGKIEFSEDKTKPDVAMMKVVTPGNWPYAQLGRSADLREYEPCISIAYPESLNQPKPTVRFGYIVQVKNERGFIQSTCLMEPGDSGGPLFDYKGRVIGLHSAIQVPEEENYEVPVDLYKKYWKALTKPLVYHSLSELNDTVTLSTGTDNILSVPALKNMGGFINEISKFKSASLSIVSKLNSHEKKAVGTLFSLKGLLLPGGSNESVIVSKSSLVGENPLILVSETKEVQLKIVVRDKDNDLVLLQPFTAIKGGIKLRELKSDTMQNIQPGKFLVSPQPDTIGMASMLGGKIFSLSKVVNAGFFGATAAYQHQPASIVWVKPNSPAAQNDIRAKDIVLTINHVPIDQSADYALELQKYWPGDTILIKVKRSDTEIEKTIVLGTVPEIRYDHPAELFSGGKSVRRDGFKGVFAHDAKLKPEQCGGPVFDLDGHFCGINIARYSRTSNLALPKSIVVDFILNGVQGIDHH